MNIMLLIQQSLNKQDPLHKGTDGTNMGNQAEDSIM